MIYQWCVECGGRTCFNENSHRAQRSIQYRADFMLGGRYGKRIRKLFPTKKDAEAYEYITQADYKRGTYLPEKTKLTFSELADKYYSDHCLKKNQRPQQDVYYRIKQAKELFGDQTVVSITKQQFREIQSKLSEKWSNATLNRFTNVVKAIFNKGIEWELIDKNPINKMPRLDEEDPIPRFLTTHEMNDLFKYFTDDRLRDYANLLLHTGARPSSIERCSFDTGDVDLPNKTIWFVTYKGRKKYRYSVPIDDVVYEIILRRIVATDGKGLVFDVSNMRTLATQAIKASGINDGKPKNRWFTIYGLKHCAASHMIMAGAKENEIARLFGHKDTRMVHKHYGHLTDEYLRKVQNKVNLSPFLPVTVRVTAENGA